MNFLLPFLLLFLSLTTARSQTDTGTHVVVSPDVTVRQYMVFLNVAALDSDPHGLYSSSIKYQITQSKQGLHNYYYFLANGASADQMLVGYNLMQERRYCNWIEHGSPTNTAAAEACTETGSYDLTGPEVIINPDAKYHLSNETGNGFAIATTVDDDSSQEEEASPLAMFTFLGGDEKKEEPRNNQAASRRESEGSSTELVFRGTLYQKGPADPTIQPQSPSNPQSLTRKEKLPNDEAKIGDANRPRSWEEQSYLAHVAYFEGRRDQQK